MKSKFIKFFVVAGFLAATVTSCYKDDFNELQKQVDELEDKVAENAKDIQEQITAIKSSISALEQQDADFSQELQTIVGDLQQISDDVQNNANTVFYGSLLTDEDYEAYKTQGADVVTGKVVITTPEQAAIVNNCRWVGQDLVTKVGSIEGIQNVGGSVVVETTDEVVNLAGLHSIGGSFKIPVSKEIKSVKADDLVVLTGELRLDKNTTSLNSLTLKSLEFVGTVYIDDLNTRYNKAGALDTLDLNDAMVIGNLELHYIVDYDRRTGTEFSVKSVGGDIIIENCGFETINLGMSEYNGNFIFRNNSVKTINANELTVINGDVDFSENYATGWGPNSYKGGLEEIHFPVLTEINGNLTVSKNVYLSDVFNSVQTINGDVVLKGKITPLKTDVIAFEELTSVNGLISIYGGFTSLKGFSKLTNYKKVLNLGVEVVTDEDGINEIRGGLTVEEDMEIFNGLTSSNITLKLNTNGMIPGLSGSFINMTHVNKISMYIFDGFEAWDGAFPVLEDVNYMYIFGEKNSRKENVTTLVDFTTSFQNLNSVKYNLDIKGNGIFEGGLKGLNIEQVKNLNVSNIKSLTLDALTAITGTFNANSSGYDDNDIELNFSKLSTINAFNLKAIANTSSFTVDMPALTTCNTLKFVSDSTLATAKLPLAGVTSLKELLLSSNYDITGSLVNVEKVTSLSLSYNKGTIDDNVLPKLNSVDNLKLLSAKDLTFDASKVLPNVQAIAKNIAVNGSSTSETGTAFVLKGTAFKSVAKVNAGYTSSLSMSDVETITTEFKAYVYAYGLKLDLPKVQVLGKLNLSTTGKSGADIDVKMPMLKTAKEVYLSINYYVPNTLNIPLAGVTQLDKLYLRLNPKDGSNIDVSNLLTSLVTLNPEVSGYAKLYYNTNQKFCSFATFLQKIDSAKLYLYKDGSYSAIPDSEEAAEIAKLTSGC